MTLRNGECWFLFKNAISVLFLFVGSKHLFEDAHIAGSYSVITSPMRMRIIMYFTLHFKEDFSIECYIIRQV